MLDDLKYIHERDVQDALGTVEKQWQQLKYDYSVQWQPTSAIQNVVVAGMGGSALAASFLKSWPGLSVPLEVVRDYQLPKYVNANTLFIASSYSGNTEETLATLEQAENQGAQVVVVAAGGKLVEKGESKNYPTFKLPGGMQPRMAVFYNFTALIQLLALTGLVDEAKQQELSVTADWLSEQIKDWLPTVPTASNPAKKLAQEIMGKSPVIYAGPLLAPVAYKWKINFNENAKNVAWTNQYPEFNHNEFLGWSSHPVDKPYAVIDLRSALDHPQVKKRFEVSERLLSGKRPAPEIVEVKGETPLQQIIWTVTLGDFVSVYLALLNGLNPTPVDLIEKLKTELAK